MKCGRHRVALERKLSLLNLPKTMFSLEAKAVIFSKTESTERGSIYTSCIDAYT